MKLNNGVEIPQIGLGTFLNNEQGAHEAIVEAIASGYRMIDTAKVYQNEKYIKMALEKTDVKREELTIVSKVWPSEYDDIETEIKRALNACGLQYFDVYMLHWPRSYAKNKEAWQQMETIYKKGYARAIAVSNFQIHHLNELIKTATIMPTINQVEVHPRLPQYNLQKYLEKYDIKLEAYGSFMRGADYGELIRVAKKHNASVEQVILSWQIARGIIVIPKSVNKERQIANLQSCELKLDEEDLKIIATEHTGKRYYSDPDNHNF